MIAVAVALALAGCSSEAEPAIVMPDVMGESLDVALSDIERAGVDDDVEIVGGGTFGIRNEANWQVCEQLPPGGEAVTDDPRLTVDRSCDDAKAQAETPADTELTTSEPASVPPTGTEPTASASPPEQPTQEPEPSGSEEAPDGEILTAETSEDLAALLSGPGGCDEAEEFAATYRDRVIRFDANIADMVNHADYDTRYDMLLYAGDHNEEGSSGPPFQFYDVNILDLGLTGSNIPDFIGQGDNILVTAGLEEFTQGCLLRLDPVSTRMR